MSLNQEIVVYLIFFLLFPEDCIVKRKKKKNVAQPSAKNTSRCCDLIKVREHL